MMHALHHERLRVGASAEMQGATLRIEILAEKSVQDFINTHAAILDKAIPTTVPGASASGRTMSEAMRQRLSRSNWIFSGMKTFHELNEAFPSLTDENGNRKPFERFLNDVQKIHETYNRNYLRAEYNFVHASADMAAKWEQFEADGDRYLLQYRTAHDDRVRPEHADLEGVTLPIDDTFWAEYYPPNGWNCRCTVVQVRRGKYPETPHDEAMTRGEAALQRDTRGMFRFNPGKEQKTVPDYNPYTISLCRNCAVAKGNSPLNLSRPSIPLTDLCQACRLVRQIKKEKLSPTVTRMKIREAQKELTNWYKQSLPEVMVGKFPSKRLVVNTSDGTEIIFNKNFYEEIISHHQDDPYYPLRLRYARNAHEIVKVSTLKDPYEEQKHHPDSFFKVYEYIDDCYRVEMKVKCNRDGNIMRYLRIYKK